MPCTTDSCDISMGCKYAAIPGCGVNNGCTPGFWKNNYGKKTGTAWPAGYGTKTLVNEFSTVALASCSGVYSSLSNTKLVDALSLQGGSTLNGKAQILLRAATAAVLKV